MGSSGKDVSLPLFIIVVALVIFFAFHLQQALTEQTHLKQVYAAQEQPLVQVRDVQQRVDRLAVATLRLAEAGNENAKEIVERLKQVGVTITPKAEAVGTSK